DLRQGQPHRHRQPDRPDLRDPDRGRHDPRDGPAPDQGRRRGLRRHVLRPGVHEHRVVPVGDHLHRRRPGGPRVPGLSDRAARRALHLPGGRLPAGARGASHRGGVRRLAPPDQHAHVRARERQEVRRRLPLRRPPDGHAAGHRRRAVDVLSRGDRGPRPRGPHAPGHPPDRQDADARGVRLPAHGGSSLRVSGSGVVLRRQLPGDALQDERAQLPAEPAARTRARHALHPARRPRAELLDGFGARGRLLARRPLLGGGGRRGRPPRSPARRRQRGGARDAAPHRAHGEHPRLHRRRQGRQGAPDGLRAPGLQELRPARQAHQARRRRRLRGHRDEPAARHRPRAGEDRPRGRLLRVAQAVSQRRLLLGPHLRGARHADADVHRALRDPADERMGRPVARADGRLRAEDRPPAADLHGRALARLRADGAAL
ncbi:MAG: Citrate synthase (si), partial [uncultured Solirubrobacteraceae bacterium]